MSINKSIPIIKKKKDNKNKQKFKKITTEILRPTYQKRNDLELKP